MGKGGRVSGSQAFYVNHLGWGWTNRPHPEEVYSFVLDWNKCGPQSSNCFKTLQAPPETPSAPVAACHSQVVEASLPLYAPIRFTEEGLPLIHGTACHLLTPSAHARALRGVFAVLFFKKNAALLQLLGLHMGLNMEHKPIVGRVQL